MSLAFFFFKSPFCWSRKTLNPGMAAEQLARHRTERVGDVDSTSQELKGGICATQKLACGFRPKEAQLEFLVAFPESTSRAVARV